MKVLGTQLVPAEELQSLKGLRRADRFSKLAVFTAKKLLDRVEIPTDALGIILCTQFGPHATTFSFLDDILDYDDIDVSPTKFSQSVHNAAAFYLGSSLAVRGPVSTVTRFEKPFQEALRLAWAWLAEQRATHVLVGYIEESSEPMAYIQQNYSLPSYSSDKLREGAFFLLLSNEGNEKIEDVIRLFEMSPLQKK